MKTAGAILIGVGLAFIIFFVYRQLQNNKSILSPIPDKNGIKVIIISPTQ